MLAQLNMLLNGDGNARLYHIPDKGSITHKISIQNKPVELVPDLHNKGNWDNWRDGTKLKKFDVVLTNPPLEKIENGNLKHQKKRNWLNFMSYGILQKLEIG